MVQKDKKKKSRIRILLVLLLLVIVIAFVYKPIINSGNCLIFEREYIDKNSLISSNNATPSSYERLTPVPTSKIEPDLSVVISPDLINSPNAILIRLADESVLMHKNSDKKIYPASLTKMMTTIVAIENIADLKEEIKLSNNTFQGLYEAGASMAGFQPGEQVKAIDLLYGVMLPSGAECCIGLAEQIAGSERDFVKMMNKKAVDLGMSNTLFENTIGLHNENHYTTVEDLSILLSYALKNDTFRKIFTSSHYSTQPTNKHPEGITLYSTMFKRLSDQTIIDGEILGGKTGYTSKAGLCLATLAKVGNQEYILITAGAKGDLNSEQYNITDALAVYNSLWCNR